MIFFQDSNIQGISIHKVGNKFFDEFYQLSEQPIDMNKIGEELKTYLMNFFCRPFSKVETVYQLFHPSQELQLNEVYHHVNLFFNQKLSFHELSELFAKQLYEVSNHPKIKGGEFYTVHFDKVMFEGEEMEAVALYKSDKKESFLKVLPAKDGFQFTVHPEAVGIDKLDKAVLILNNSQEDGYRLLVVDNSSNGEKVVWKDEFLEVKARNDQFQKTSTFMKLTRSFIYDKLDEVFELNKSDKACLLNRSLEYLKSNESLDVHEFVNEVFRAESIGELFKSYKERIEEEFEINIGDTFNISSSAIKKVQSSYKSIIKLDSNFNIYIHGKSDLIENGFDKERGMNYYKVFYNNEN